ncbi:hypothetical protein COV16_07240 [Candidatus Woesearchaeota archaeon CG10_big_fil_rev_8_21_14_0_10_34_8]|nr:MAG: hypothetical protein COV16_07240 [Candidatus Woesearchaeota archaeon CG10_big_fil_rev_8_21_14_0_10_34_8]
MGPSGTDSENAAHLLQQSLQIPGKIILHETFHLALAHAVQQSSYFLMPAAYTARDRDGKLTESWADLHFSCADRMQLCYATVLPLQEMCVAKQFDVINPGDILLHPSTSIFAERYAPTRKRKFVHAKPLAVLQCSEGIAESCIGSVKVVEQYSSLVIEERFQPSMAWTLYIPLQ